MSTNLKDMGPTSTAKQQFELLKKLLMDASFIYMDYLNLWQNSQLKGESEWHAKIWKLYDFTIKEQISKLIIELNLSGYFMDRIDNGHFIDYPDLRGSMVELEAEYVEALRLYDNKELIDQKIMEVKSSVEEMENTFNHFFRAA